jgi:hypothetical protein
MMDVKEGTLRQGLASLAEELDRDADERERMAVILPPSETYVVERIRLTTGARHQRRASVRIRRLLDASEVG